MRRRVRDFTEISDSTTLDSLINTLVAIRDNLPEDAEPELKLRGDDVFGRRLTICYLRELTTEEAECDARYTGGVIESDPSLEDLKTKLDKIPFDQDENVAKRRIRRVA
jgi:hypothetical protein